MAVFIDCRPTVYKRYKLLVILWLQNGTLYKASSSTVLYALGLLFASGIYDAVLWLNGCFY